MDSSEYHCTFEVAISPPPPPCSMHMLPRSHDSGFYKHEANSKFHIDYTMVDTPRPEDVSSAA